MKNISTHPVRRIVSIGIALACTLIGAIFWVNNLVAAIRLHRALANGVAPTGGGKGLLHCLQWSVVDVSTVTTFIFFFGFAVTTIALWGKIRDVEFFTRHDRFHIALGLVGTLWGIILIGYYPIANVTIPSLMNCLHTAMFSTLAAIVWVMIIEPLVIFPWVRFALAGDDETIPEADPVATMQEITASLQKFSAVLTQSSDAAEKFQAQLAAWQNARQQEIQESEKFRAESLKALQLLTEITASLDARQQALATENDRLQKGLETATAERDSARATAEELRRKLEAIRATLG